MIELRKDIISSRWVIINDTRDFQLDVPQPMSKEAVGACPFCVGNENLIPSPISCYDKNGAKINVMDKDWHIKVIPNNKPILTIEGNIIRKAEGIYDKMKGVGAHEIFIEAQEHDDSHLYDNKQNLVACILAMQDRINDLRNDTRLEYILIYRNHGAAYGETVTHPHFQLVALPFIPKAVADEISISKKHYEFRERCLFCDVIDQELATKTRIVMETENFVSFIPFASRFPFETWIFPKEHTFDYRVLNDKNKIEDLAEVVIGVTRKLFKALGRNISYTLLLHSYPLKENKMDHFHWHIEVIPRLAKYSGFDLVSGMYVNPTVPEESAKFLREA
ncbi:MAG: galactose-1-phosphate uridylyltransferase [Elusimicrobia bacterium]|nr:galactose-1-phosphate uridylyltransferase [Elusimicrobiota bacterium]